MNIHKKDPSLGDDPSVSPAEEHRLSVDFNGAHYVTSRHTPAWMPRPLHLLAPWLDAFIATMNSTRTVFPEVFSGQFPYSAHLLTQARDAYASGAASRESLAGLQRFVTMWMNIVMFGRPERVLLDPPRAEAGMLPPAAAPAIGIVGVVTLMGEALARHPAWNEAYARQFGMLPSAGPSPDPETLDPGVSARLTGEGVVLSFRSPTNTPGVNMASIRCDRGDGHLHPVGTTTHARFTDHHDLPAERAVWRYVVEFITHAGTPVGQQSSCEIIVQARE